MQDIMRTRRPAPRSGSSVQSRQQARGAVQADIHRRTIQRPRVLVDVRPVRSDQVSSRRVVPSSEQQAPRTDTRKQLARYARKASLWAQYTERQTVAPRPAVEQDISGAPGTTRRGLIQRFGAGFTAVAILLVTGYVSIDTFLTNREVKAAFTSSSEVSSESNPVNMSEGQDETPLPSNALEDYAVSPDRPRALYIDSTNVAARILPMSVNTDGSMQAPIGIYDTGWYEGSSKPGEVGAVVVNGHSSGPTRDGVFGTLADLQLGDILRVERGDGTMFSYRLTMNETVEKDAVDMSKLMLPYGNSMQGINIITCVGEYIPAEKTFSHRLVVYAELIEASNATP